MEKQPLISVIIPVYNVFDYLDECIKSVLKQSYTNLEIIIVDDGSSDGSGKKCDEWAQKDKRIVVIHKENGGLSSARNAGILVAHGEFYAFVDSDDFIDPQMYKILLNGILRHDADISCCFFCEYHSGDGYISAYQNVDDASEEVLSSEEAISSLFDDFGYRFYAWNKLYKRELFNDVKYPEGKICEDISTTYKVFDMAKKIVVNRSKLYFYRIRNNSITNMGFYVSNSSMFDLRDESNYVFNKISEKYPNIKKRVISGYICYLFRFVTRAYINDINVQEDSKKLKELMRENFYLFIFSDRIMMVKKIQAIVFLLFPKSIYKFFYNLVKK